MTVKLTITAIGTPKTIQTKNGPREKNYLKAQEYNDKFLNYWINNTTKSWAVGQVIEVEAVEENKYISKKDGSEQTSYDIRLPKKEGFNNQSLEKIQNDVFWIKLAVKEILDWKREVHGTKTQPYPEPKDQGLDEENMANFDPKEVESLEEVYNSM